MMDLNPADMALLNQVRKRHRFARFGSAVFALMTWAFLSAALWFGLRASALKTLIGIDPMKLHAMLSACGMCSLVAIRHAGMGVSAWRQSVSDALILKLADQRSGYPDYTR